MVCAIARGPPSISIGIDEVSRRKGQVYLNGGLRSETAGSVVGRRDRTEEAVKNFFTEEMGRRRCHTLQVVCMDMWAPYAKLVREHAVNAQILFDRFHIVKHLNEAVDGVRRELWRQPHFQRESECQRNTLAAAEEPVESHPRSKRAALDVGGLEYAAGSRLVLKEAFQLFWDYTQPWRGRAASAQVDQFGYALQAGAVQEIRKDACALTWREFFPGPKSVSPTEPSRA